MRKLENPIQNSLGGSHVGSATALKYYTDGWLHLSETLKIEVKPRTILSVEEG